MFKSTTKVTVTANTKRAAVAWAKAIAKEITCDKNLDLDGEITAERAEEIWNRYEDGDNVYMDEDGTYNIELSSTNNVVNDSPVDTIKNFLPTIRENLGTYTDEDATTLAKYLNKTRAKIYVGINELDLDSFERRGQVVKFANNHTKIEVEN